MAAFCQRTRLPPVDVSVVQADVPGACSPVDAPARGSTADGRPGHAAHGRLLRTVSKRYCLITTTPDRAAVAGSSGQEREGSVGA
jgi:hypothetical protein